MNQYDEKPLPLLLHHRKLILLFILATALFASLWVLTVPPTWAGGSIDCNQIDWSVGNQGDLIAAISCFNAKTSPGTYTISISQGIILTASTFEITNSTTGVELLIEGNGFTVEGNGTSLGLRPFSIAANTTVTFNDIIIRQGSINSGGGIYNEGTVTINNSTISDNTVDGGGGGGISNLGTAFIFNSIISGNSGGFGGGIYNEGIITVSNSTIISNTAVAGGGFNNSSFGTAIINNSTINNNSANRGGGISNGNSATLMSNNSTISGNSADNVGGIDNFGVATISNNTLNDHNGGGIYNGATITVNNTIIANSINGGDCFGSIISAGHNIASDSSCNLTGDGDLTDTNPMLESLQDNGGPTFTHALMPTSPAIDAGNTSLTQDQRGIARPQGLADDIGAFELKSFNLFLPLILSSE